MFIDTHCHLDFPEFDSDRQQVINHAREEGVSYIVNVGSSLESSQASVELTKEYDFIYAAVGIHPHDTDKFNEDIYSSVRALASQAKVVAIGEIGLDYYRNYSTEENQKKTFISLLSLAKELKLPVILHIRQAQEPVMEIIKDFLPLRAVVHCFSGDRDFLQKCLSLDFFVSFTCNVTYKKADNLRSIIKSAPLEKMFLETDAPYLSPESMRGLRNEPVGVKAVAEEIARIKKLEVEEIAAATTNNAKRFFNI